MYVISTNSTTWQLLGFELGGLWYVENNSFHSWKKGGLEAELWILLIEVFKTCCTDKDSINKMKSLWRLKSHVLLGKNRSLIFDALKMMRERWEIICVWQCSCACSCCKLQCGNPANAERGKPLSASGKAKAKATCNIILTGHNSLYLTASKISKSVYNVIY